jgi:hypothetical protein
LAATYWVLHEKDPEFRKMEEQRIKEDEEVEKEEER